VPPGHIRTALREAGVEHVVFEAWRDGDWPSADGISALIVLGGTMNVDQLDDYPFLARSRDLMAATLDMGLPTLGVCLGSQMMARVLGADVYRAEPRNAAFSPLELTSAGGSDPIAQPFAGSQSVLQFHEDTFQLPRDATLLATSGASGLHQAFRYGENAYGVQFHFEVDQTIVRGWIDDIGADALQEEWGISADEIMAQLNVHLAEQARAGRDLMRSFISMAGSD
jgi:GMP synthase (glutamine-hydrolysing)